MGKILYVFTSGRKARLQQQQTGQDVPLEFLYGAPYLQQHGYTVDILELADLQPDINSPEYHALHQTNRNIQQRYRFTSKSQFFVGAAERLNAYDVIIANGESTAFGMAHFINNGAVRTPLVYFVMGMLAYIPTLKAKTPQWSGWRTVHNYLYERFYNTRYRCGKQIYQELIQASRHVLFLGQGEYAYAQRVFPAFRRKFYFLPFAVDTDFWTPAQERPEQPPYILFMGNDRQRDFELVITIATQLPHYHFTFVTRGIRPADAPPNAKVLAGDWKEPIFSDVDIRRLIRQSTLVMLPLKETFKPSGQSVALQAMACGKPVIISRNSGFWEPEVFIDQTHLWFVSPNTLDEWCAAIEAIMQDKERRSKLGRNARQLVERNNNLQQFGRRLEAIISETR